MTRASVVWRLVVTIEAAILMLLGIAGLTVDRMHGGWNWHNDAGLLFFRINPVHSAFLIAVGLAAMFTATWQRTLVWWAAAQATGFTVLFLYGTAQSTAEKSSTVFELDATENFLHAGLAAAGFVILAGATAYPGFRIRWPHRLWLRLPRQFSGGHTTRH
jgi:hypothetical protein